MPGKKLKEYLDRERVAYKVIPHRPVYTAQETAAMVHIPGQQLAKTVMIKIDGRMALAVVPAHHRVDFNALKKHINVRTAVLASEIEFRDRFPDCEIGAMPPFGNLYGMDIFVARSLSKDIVIAFCAGSHAELIQLAYADFVRLAKPQVIDFSIKDAEVHTSG